MISARIEEAPPKATAELTIYEELFLLAIHKHHGRARLPAAAVGSSILAELALRGHVAFLRRDNPMVGEYYVVKAIKDEPTGDVFLDECFDLIHEEDGVVEKRLHVWANEFGCESNGVEKKKLFIASTLVGKGIVAEENGRDDMMRKCWGMWRSKKRRWKVLDVTSVHAIGNRIRSAVLHGSDDDRTKVLTTLIWIFKLAGELFEFSGSKVPSAKVRERCDASSFGRALRWDFKGSFEGDGDVPMALLMSPG